VSLPLLKTAFALVVLATGVLGALLPWALRSKTPGERILARGDTFAGGVLGGAGLLHLLGDGIDGLHALAPRQQYPLALLLAGIGFLLILLIEGVIVGERSLAHGAHAPHRHPAASHELGSGTRPIEAGRAQAYVLLLVLSVHSIIVGLALGAQRSLPGALIVFIAIIAHKGVAGFALGVGYARPGTPWRHALPGIAFFATMTPLGIGVGTALSAFVSGPAGTLLEAVFDSLGAGTFLYIAALDIIGAEFSSPDDRWAKWVWASLGFATMALLALWV
jgi:zinc transporter 1/2/3